MKGATREGAVWVPLGWGGRRVKNNIKVLEGKRGMEARTEDRHNLLKRDYALWSGDTQ